jgi:predicted nucleotidyltransferase
VERGGDFLIKPIQPTPYSDVNEVLHHFLVNIQDILKRHFVGMYVIGSLAIGDFNPNTSDIDFIVVTKASLDDHLFGRLKQMHSEFASSNSPWAKKVEVVYVPVDVLPNHASPSAQYPQIEDGTELFKDVLEQGWVFQAYTLREKSIVVAGPDLHTTLEPINPKEMIPAVRSIAGRWLEGAEKDPTWLDWLENRDCQVFVVQTLCRMLYSLKTGSVTSKPAAAKWAQQNLESPWDDLIAHTLFRQFERGKISQGDLADTVNFIQYIYEQAAV